MKNWKTLIMSVVLSLGMALNVQAAVNNNEPAPDFALMSSTGQEVKLSDQKGKYVVLEWVNFECPFVKKHYQSQNMQAIQKKLTEQGVVWLSINSSAEGKQGFYSAEEINEIIKNANASPTAYLLDTDGEVGQTYGAQTTPHMYIIDPDGQLIYQGAIDDNPSFDPAVIPASKNYILAAMEEAMAGKAVSVASTKSYGCSVKY